MFKPFINAVSTAVPSVDDIEDVNSFLLHFGNSFLNSSSSKTTQKCSFSSCTGKNEVSLPTLINGLHCIARKIDNRDVGSYIFYSFLEDVGGFCKVFAGDMFVHCWYYLAHIAASSTAINLNNTHIVIHTSQYSFNLSFFVLDRDTWILFLWYQCKN